MFGQAFPHGRKTSAMLPARPGEGRRIIRMPRRTHGRIHIGVGGWTFEPWRGSFYPVGLPHRRELEHASRQLTSLEINGTYYGSQKPESFARWYEETPEGFVFSVKGPRFTTNRRVLAEAAPSIERFFNSGVLQLKEKLGPVNWQFLPTKSFVPEDFAAFLKLLPHSIDGHPIRHAIEVRHASFRAPELVALAREHEVAIVVAGDSDYPQIADPTAPFVYARVMGSSEAEPLGYPESALDLWAERARLWAAGEVPRDLETLSPPTQAAGPKDVFLYVISGAKVRNPDAATALIARLD
jgi:uncharacterized protein YecE (DUF72 family)